MSSEAVMSKEHDQRSPGTGLGKDQPGLLGRVVRALLVAEKWTTGLFVVTILVLLLAQVVARYWLNAPIRWSDELARFTMIWLTFVGAAMASAEDRHIAVVVFDSRISPTFRRRLKYFVNLVPIALGAVWIYTGWEPVQRGMGTSSTAMGIPMGFVYGATLVGFVLIVIHSVANILALRYEVEGVTSDGVPGGGLI
jgi:TRAP-type transport system small permease protein